MFSDLYDGMIAREKNCIARQLLLSGSYQVCACEDPVRLPLGQTVQSCAIAYPPSSTSYPREYCGHVTVVTRDELEASFNNAHLVLERGIHVDVVVQTREGKALARFTPATPEASAQAEQAWRQYCQKDRTFRA